MIIPLPQIFFSDLSAFFSLCNRYFSQTQSLPKLNILYLSLVQDYWAAYAAKKDTSPYSCQTISFQSLIPAILNLEAKFWEVNNMLYMERGSLNIADKILRILRGETFLIAGTQYQPL